LTSSGDSTTELKRRAADAFEHGRLAEARVLYEELLARRPDRVGSRLQLALVAKYQRDWPACLAQSLEALRAGGGRDETASWTAGIAATALGDWAQARKQWQACGIALAPGSGPVEEAFGPVALRLNPWASAETVFAHRIDPARARIANVPLPGSGHRFRDLVLHDGTQVGQRKWYQHAVPVFNELQRLEPSDFRTFTVFVSVDADVHIEVLQHMRAHGVGQVEDWTAGLGRRCLRCVYGLPHRHRWLEGGAPVPWDTDRTLGIAAHHEGAARDLIDRWIAESPEHRRLEAVEAREAPAPHAGAMRAWWR
jgi:hypothetical protein